MRATAVVASELVKAATLPALGLTAVAAVLTGGVLGAALATGTPGDAAAPASDLLVQVVPYLQAVFVLLGVLPVAHEYAGAQMQVSLTAVPVRSMAVAGKSVAVLLLAAITAVVAVGATLAGAALASRLDIGEVADAIGAAAGVTAALVLTALLSAAVALLTRGLVPALVTMLAGLMIVSPFLAALTEHARWLPDRAARLLYGGVDTVLSASTGALVALSWVAGIGGVAAWRFARRDV